MSQSLSLANLTTALSDSSALPTDNCNYYSSTLWPNYWPQTVYYNYPVATSDGYANELKIELREHDATVTFLRNGAQIASLIVPRALLAQFTKSGRRK